MFLVADDHVLELTRSRVEHDIVHFSKLVPEIAERSLAKKVELPFDGRLFMVVDRQAEGAVIDDHNGVGPKPLRSAQSTILALRPLPTTTAPTCFCATSTTKCRTGPTPRRWPG